jgi:DNA-binding response OmpR family regulator
MALILVIDDRATMRKLVRRMPVRADHAVVDAEDGEAGLAAFERHQPDVVITDLFMPKKEGIETIRLVRRLQPIARVIAMSRGDEINLQSARKLGADEILAKPFEMAVLLDMVNRMLAIERESHRNNRGVTSGPTRPAAEASSREPTAPSLMRSPVSTGPAKQLAGQQPSSNPASLV